MRYRIHFTVPQEDDTYDDDEYHDSVVVEGETLADVQSKASEELQKRGGISPWSERLSDN